MKLNWFQRLSKDKTANLMLPTIRKEDLSESEGAVLRRLLAQPECRLLLRLLADAVPVPTEASALTPTGVAFAAGVSVGYTRAVQTLRELAEPPQKEIEATFQPTE